MSHPANPLVQWIKEYRNAKHCSMKEAMEALKKEHNPKPTPAPIIPAPILADPIRERYRETVPTSQSAAELRRLTEINGELLDACENSLETLIGCCIPAGGVDDRKTILETQSMLRAAIKKAKGQS